jgi:threonine dehydratase
VEAMQGLGAEVLFHGPDFDTAREWIMSEADKHGGTFVGPTDEPLICGVGTYGLEIMEELPEVDIIIVPVGAGSGACGTAIAAKSIKPSVQVIGVQSAQAPAMQKSWLAGELLTAAMGTVAEGLATRVPFQNTQAIMREMLDDFVVVNDSDLEEGVRLLLHHTHNLTEEAGAAALAAALQNKERVAGKNLVLVVSGGNISMERLQTILTQDGPHI